MPRLVNSIPKYRKHKASGQAIVTLGGRDHYLGPYGCRTSRATYDQLIAEYLGANRQFDFAPQVKADTLLVVELLAAYWKFCKTYYVKNGVPTNEQDAIRLIIQDVRTLYESLPASEFGPIALKAVRQRWIKRGQARPTVNKNMRRLTRIFRWAVAEELVPSGTYQALVSVPGLKKGRTQVPEPPPILPVKAETVKATIVFLPRILQDMVRIQLLTGMRPGEICRLRPIDIDRSCDVWEYRPESHKTEHHNRTRIVFLGPEAQGVLSPYLNRDESQQCFSPAENMRHYRRQLSAERKTPLSCGNRPGTNRVASPQRKPRTAYDPNSYRQAVHRACDKAFPPQGELAKKVGESQAMHQSRLSSDQLDQLRAWRKQHRWAPNQLRHAAATSIRKQFGLEAAQVILGHAAADVTQVYAERDADKAREVARRVG